VLKSVRLQLLWTIMETSGKEAPGDLTARALQRKLVVISCLEETAGTKAASISVAFLLLISLPDAILVGEERLDPGSGMPE